MNGYKRHFHIQENPIMTEFLINMVRDGAVVAQNEWGKFLIGFIQVEFGIN